MIYTVLILYYSVDSSVAIIVSECIWLLVIAPGITVHMYNLLQSDGVSILSIQV